MYLACSFKSMYLRVAYFLKYLYCSFCVVCAKKLHVKQMQGVEQQDLQKYFTDLVALFFLVALEGEVALGFALRLLIFFFMQGNIET